MAQRAPMEEGLSEDPSWGCWRRPSEDVLEAMALRVAGSLPGRKKPGMKRSRSMAYGGPAGSAMSEISARQGGRGDSWCKSVVRLPLRACYS